MRNDKHLAVKLRKQGKSYKKISEELDMPKSTLSGWFSNVGWSIAVKRELTRKANYVSKKRLFAYNRKRQKEWEAWREEARQEATRTFPKLKSNHLFLAGLMLYWGEGDSKIENSNVRLTNTDGVMIKIFTSFLKNICDIPKDKIRINLILYPDLDENICKDFWSKSAEIPKNQFIKSQIIKGRHPTKRLSNGICIVYVSSRQLKEKIYTWMKLYQSELTRA